jgi:integrase
MPRKAQELGPLAVSHLKTPGLHFVGEVPGLALQVLPGGGRTWVLRMMIGDRRRDMGLGGYPEVSLKDAREAAREARRKVRNEGVDPIEERRKARSALLASAAKMKTFKQAAEAYIADQEAGWKNPKHRQQWRNSLEAYAYPKIGALSVADIALPHVLDVIKPIWTEKTETASRVRGRVETVLDWAVAHGYRDGLTPNPARWRGHLEMMLPHKSKIAKPQHHRALALDDLGAFMLRLRAGEGMGARALEFAILTAGRSGEVRGATWAEIDLAARLWTIPASRMKADRPHRVALSQAAVDLLQALPHLADADADAADLVFWAPRGGMLSDMTLTAVLRRMQVDATAHGMRSCFSDWCGERTAYPTEMAELALAHAVSDKTEAAYRRGDMLQKRVRMMDDWARFLAQPEPATGVTPLRSRA